MASERVKNSFFFTIKDGTYKEAEQVVLTSALGAIHARYKPANQSTLFFAAARESGGDSEARSLCSVLVERGVPVNSADELNQTALYFASRQGHARTISYLLSKGANPNLRDKNGETPLFYAVSYRRMDAVKALLAGGADLEVANNWCHTCMSVATEEILEPLKEERKRRRSIDEMTGQGSPVKRQRTALQQLEAWADEWPMREPVEGSLVNFKSEDVVCESDAYVVVKNPGDACAARLRVSEKHFVVDHAKMFVDEPWFEHVPIEEWCSDLGVLPDEGPLDPVKSIKGVLNGELKAHFSLVLLHKSTKQVAGYVHATYAADQQEMTIAHVKVDKGHMNQGLGCLLVRAAEDFSQRIGWQSQKIHLTVLKENARAKRCYAKAGFRKRTTNPASWSSNNYVASSWESWSKVLKHATVKKRRRK